MVGVPSIGSMLVSSLDKVEGRIGTGSGDSRIGMEVVAQGGTGKELRFW